MLLPMFTRSTLKYRHLRSAIDHVLYLSFFLIISIVHVFLVLTCLTSPVLSCVLLAIGARQRYGGEHGSFEFTSNAHARRSRGHAPGHPQRRDKRGFLCCHVGAGGGSGLGAWHFWGEYQAAPGGNNRRPGELCSDAFGRTAQQPRNRSHRFRLVDARLTFGSLTLVVDVGHVPQPWAYRLINGTGCLMHCWPIRHPTEAGLLHIPRAEVRLW